MANNAAWSGSQTFTIDGVIYTITDEIQACHLSMLLSLINEIAFLTSTMRTPR